MPGAPLAPDESLMSLTFSSDIGTARAQRKADPVIAHNYYDEETFWKIWNKPNYDAVKASRTRRTCSAICIRRRVERRAGSAEDPEGPDGIVTRVSRNTVIIVRKTETPHARH